MNSCNGYVLSVTRLLSGKRSLRIDASLNSDSNLNAGLFQQSGSPVCPRNFHETLSTKLSVHETFTKLSPRNL